MIFQSKVTSSSIVQGIRKNQPRGLIASDFILSFFLVIRPGNIVSFRM